MAGTNTSLSMYSVQVNIPAESGDMGILANHVPSIEQLRPGVIDIIEESGGSKQYFSTPQAVAYVGRVMEADVPVP